MNIKKIAKLCKSASIIKIFEDGPGGVQWLSDGRAAYPMYKMPRLTPADVSTVFGMTDKQAEDCIISSDTFPAGILAEDAVEAENIVEPAPVDLILSGNRIRPYYTSRGLLLIDTRFLEPLGAQENVELYERQNENGTIYLVAKVGFTVLAVILPLQGVSESLKAVLSKMQKNNDYALSFKEE